MRLTLRAQTPRPPMSWKPLGGGRQKSSPRKISIAGGRCSKEKRIHLMKLSEALCDYVHVRQVRFRTLVEEGEDGGGECSA